MSQGGLSHLVADLYLTLSKPTILNGHRDPLMMSCLVPQEDVRSFDG
jgi:hypothetical protein